MLGLDYIVYGELLFMINMDHSFLHVSAMEAWGREWLFGLLQKHR